MDGPEWSGLDLGGSLHRLYGSFGGPCVPICVPQAVQMGRGALLEVDIADHLCGRGDGVCDFSEPRNGAQSRCAGELEVVGSGGANRARGVDAPVPKA